MLVHLIILSFIQLPPNERKTLSLWVVVEKFNRTCMLSEWCLGAFWHLKKYCILLCLATGYEITFERLDFTNIHKRFSLGMSVSMILHFIASNARNSSELHSPARRMEEMFYSFLIHKLVRSSGPWKGIQWWNWNTADSVYATMNLLIFPQGRALGLLQSLAEVKNTRVQRD